MTIENYISENCLTKIRLYLLSKPIHFIDLVNNQACDDEEDFDIKTTPKVTRSMSGTNLLGTSEERARLKNEIDQAYNESLAIDMSQGHSRHIGKKVNELNSPKIDDVDCDLIVPQVVRNGAAVVLERQSRLPEEPNLMDDHIVLSVRTGNGTKRRLFSSSAKVMQIYDWVGTIEGVPLYFKLVYNKMILEPESLASNYSQRVLDIEEVDFPFPQSNSQPREEIAPPWEEIASPREEYALPMEEIAPPWEEIASPREEIAPPAVVSQPSEDVSVIDVEIHLLLTGKNLN